MVWCVVGRVEKFCGILKHFHQAQERLSKRWILFTEDLDLNPDMPDMTESLNLQLYVEKLGIIYREVFYVDVRPL